MKKCASCKILFNTNETNCPLCQNVLTGHPKELNFPQNIRHQTNSLILKIILFASLTILLIFGFTEFMITHHLKYTIYISVGLLTNFLIVSYILKYYQNIYRMFGRYGLLIIIILLIWYLVTKSHILTNYIIPSVCLTELLFNLILCLILKKNYFIKYSSQLLLNLVLLFLPLILVFLKLTTNNILSYICTLISIITILALIIFLYPDLKEELKKIFNL